MARIWETTYKGHKIRVENRFSGENLFINDELQDSRSGISTHSELSAKIKVDGKEELIKVKLAEGKSGGVECQLSINDEAIPITES